MKTYCICKFIRMILTIWIIYSGRGGGIGFEGWLCLLKEWVVPRPGFDHFTNCVSKVWILILNWDMVRIQIRLIHWKLRNILVHTECQTEIKYVSSNLIFFVLLDITLPRNKVSLVFYEILTLLIVYNSYIFQNYVCKLCLDMHHKAVLIWDEIRNFVMECKIRKSAQTLLARIKKPANHISPCVIVPSWYGIKTDIY